MKFYNFREAALAIVNDDNWKMAMRNCTVEGTKATTPMRKLIKKLPGLVTFSNSFGSMLKFVFNEYLMFSFGNSSQLSRNNDE